MLISVSIGAMLSGCRFPTPHARTEFLLGTAITITTYTNRDAQRLDPLFERIAQIEQRMSSTREDYDTTEILAIAHAAGSGEPAAVSADTAYVIERGLYFSELTEGAFDISIDPLAALWSQLIGASGERVQLPDPAQILEVRQLVDWRAVQFSEEGIALPVPGMGLDVGGIGKGYAADEAVQMLAAQEIETGLLDFGGNIILYGTKPDGTDWRIGTQKPDGARGEYISILTFSPSDFPSSSSYIAVVTSGDYERYFIQDGMRYHHIIDTATGYPVRNGLRSVTVIAHNSLDADALSTALFVMGLDAGTQLIGTIKDGGTALASIEVIFVTRNGEVIATPALADKLEIVDESYSLMFLE